MYCRVFFLLSFATQNRSIYLTLGIPVSDDMAKEIKYDSKVKENVWEVKNKICAKFRVYTQ